MFTLPIDSQCTFRVTLVDLQLEKAHRFLAQADKMYSMQYWDQEK